MVSNGEGDETVAGIGDEGHAGITDESDGGAAFHGKHEFGSASDFVVVVITDEGFLNFKMIEQFQSVASIFAGDLIDFLEDAEGAQGDVLKIADGSGNEIEAAAAVLRKRIRMRIFVHGV